MVLACIVAANECLDLEPISTSNLLTIVQIIVVIGGFYFSVRSLKATRESIRVASDSLKVAAQNFDLGTKNAQAQLFNQLVLQGRDLQFRFVDIFHDAQTEEGRRSQRSHFLGTLIGYYASCFELRNVLALPPIVEKLLEAELKELMCKEEIRAKWEAVKHLHSAEFVAHVERLRGGVK